MSIPLPPPQPVITIQCDIKPACAGVQFAVTCPAGYLPSPTSQLTIRHAEIDYYRKIRSVLTSTCIKKPASPKKSRHARAR
jgi:hypothetical protein